MSFVQEPVGRRPVVLQIIPTLVTGGAERGCVDMALALAQSGGTALVASAGGHMVRELERAGIPHFTLPLASKNPFVIWRNIRRIENLIATYGVDIVHARSRAPAWSAWYAAKRAGVAFMTSFHAPYNGKSRLKKKYNSIMARGDRVIAVSSFIRDHILQNYAIDPAKIRLIHRGIDTALFSPDKVPSARLIQLARAWNVAEDAQVIMLPGRLTRWKGHKTLIEAVAKLNRRDVRCLLVGGDQGRTDYRHELKQQIHKLGLDGIVQIVDHCNDMPAAYLLSDVVVSASTDPEAFGRVIVEAQAMGKPVIVTNLGAVQETVVPGETAWVVPPSDADAMAQALAQALALTPEQRTWIAQRAMAHVGEVFTRTRMCHDTLAVYDELMQEKNQTL